MNFSTFQDVNWFLYFCVFSAELLAMSFGIALGWTSPAIPILYSSDRDNPFPEPITMELEAGIVGLLSLGAFCGVPFAGILTHRFGRKKTMVLSAVIITAAFMMIAFAPSVEYCISGRFILGVGCGFSISVLPTYIGEIVGTSKRGAFGCMFGIMVTVGVTITYIVGSLTSFRVFTIICAVPSFLCLLTFGIFAPESPYYYMSCENIDAAIESLNKLQMGKDSIDKTLVEINKYILESSVNKGGFTDLINSKRGKRSLMICCVTMLFQQLSGIPVINASMQSILDASNSGIPADISSVFISVVNVIMNTVTSQMADRLGRKILLVISSAGCMIFLAVLATYFCLQNNGYNIQSIYWLPVASITAYFVTIGLGIGPLPWAVVAEMFPHHLKGICTAITTMIFLISFFLATFSYPFVKSAIGPEGMFYALAAFSGFGTLFFGYVLPETKGKTFEEIQIALGEK